ncbi:hypothetical protein HBI14_008090 [Parastagonospora nodorum]|nr:hypothetical protein HBI14_008090 [Parastagonospora nodorum]
MLFLISCATEKVHIYAADSLSSTVIVYNHIKKDKNADLVIADSISDALDICAKDDLIRRKGLRLAEELATAESVTAKDSNYVDTFSLDFAFSFANILSLIAFIISYCLFADKLNIQQSLLDRVTVVPIIISRLTPSTLLAEFIPTTKIRDPLLKTLENVAKSRILLACADGRIRQYYLTICAILKHYNFNIYVSLATDTLHLLLKGLVIKMLDFMQDMLDNIYPSTVVSLLFISKAPFALHFIRTVCDLVILAINIFKKEFRVYQRTLEEKKNFNYPKALDSICTRANSKAYYITIVKQFYSITNKKEYILQIYRTYSIRVTRPLPFCRLRYKRHNDSKYCNEEHRDNRRQSRIVIDSRVVAQLHLILIIINYTCYDKDRKHMAYIRAFSKVLLFNNNRQIDNTTRMLSILQAFKFYDLSTIICSVHLVPRDLPNLITYTTISYYVNNYID